MKRKTIIIIATTILGLWLVLGLAPLVLFSSPADQASFGDMFGAVNALFSGLALAGVVCAILLQREELTLQRKELEMTRAELARSAEAQSESSRTLIRQHALAERNIRLQAYTALLQSCNEKIMAERARIDAMDPRTRSLFGTKMPSLKMELERLENEVMRLIQKNENEPNKTMETTPVAVTPPASAGAAPSTSASHL